MSLIPHFFKNKRSKAQIFKNKKKKKRINNVIKNTALPSLTLSFHLYYFVAGKHLLFSCLIVRCCVRVQSSCRHPFTSSFVLHLFMLVRALNGVSSASQQKCSTTAATTCNASGDRTSQHAADVSSVNNNNNHN